MHSLELKNVQRTFTNTQTSLVVLKECSAVFNQGTTYGLVGHSGLGKSTLMHLLAGIDAPTSGTVVYDGENIQIMNPKERIVAISFVIQTPHMIKELTAYENCQLAGKIIGLSNETIQERLDELFELLELDHTRNWNVGQLSGGQLQRIALIRALVVRPTFLLADEPTGNLDQETGKQLLNTMLTCQKKWGMGLIISSHNSYVIDQMSVVFTIKNGILVPVL
jgi:lipoprotein-releasing system ATP-binding protein